MPNDVNSNTEKDSYPDKDGGIAICWSWSKFMAKGGWDGEKGGVVHLQGSGRKTMCGRRTRHTGAHWEFDYWMPEMYPWDNDMSSVTCLTCLKINETRKKSKVAA